MGMQELGQVDRSSFPRLAMAPARQVPLTLAGSPAARRALRASRPQTVHDKTEKNACRKLKAKCSMRCRRCGVRGALSAPFACATGWAFRRRCWRQAPGLAAPGIGTATPARAAIPRAMPTATPSRRICCEDWEWSERYPEQPEIMRYLNHVADRFDLKRDIRFNSRVPAAQYDEARQPLDTS